MFKIKEFFPAFTSVITINITRSEFIAVHAGRLIKDAHFFKRFDKLEAFFF
jgi:hypothetical protein